MKKILSILLALGVILGLTLGAAPVAAQPCVCPPGSTPLVITDLLAPPAFCAGALSHYSITGGVTPQALLSDTDKLSVDFPADTDLSGVTATDVTIQGWNPAAITVNGQHLEFVIPFAAYGVAVIPMGSPITITVDKVTNPTVADTYCLYLDFCDDAICTSIQFDCGTYVVAPAIKDIGIHFDFGTTYMGIAEDYIPAFKACGDDTWGFWDGAIPGYTTNFDLIVRDENGGCNNPCADPPMGFWWEVTKCPAGEQIFVDDGVGTYTVDATDIGVSKFSMLPIWIPFPTAPVDNLYPMRIHFSSPGEYELQFFIQCPAGGCPLCGGPTIIATGVLAATAYQYMDAWYIDLEEKWNLISLPLFPYDTSIANVLGSMTNMDQLVSAWYFDQCEDPAPDVGVWHSAAYDAVAGTFAGDLTDIRAGNAYWIRMLHTGETGHIGAHWPNIIWVFGTHAIMPTPIGVDMGSFDVCEGWNMVGFKPPWPPPAPLVPVGQVDGFAGVGYLWNFNGAGQVNYGLIYQWNPAPLPGDWTTWLPGTLGMIPGEGYWIPFDGDGEIYPSA